MDHRPVIAHDTPKAHMSEASSVQQQSPINIDRRERIAYMVAGAALAVFGLARRGGALLAVPAGLFIALKGATGRSPLYRKLGMNTAVRSNADNVSVPHRQGVHLTRTVTVQRDAASVFRFWMNPENVLRAVPQLYSLELAGHNRARAVFTTNAAARAEFDIELVNFSMNEVVAWRTVGQSAFAAAGSVRLSPTETGGTEIRVELEYVPPVALVGDAVVKMLGIDPDTLLQETLRRARQLIETGDLTGVDE